TWPAVPPPSPPWPRARAPVPTRGRAAFGARVRPFVPAASWASVPARSRPVVPESRCRARERACPVSRRRGHHGSRAANLQTSGISCRSVDGRGRALGPLHGGKSLLYVALHTRISKVPTAMRALCLTATGGPQHLAVLDVPPPGAPSARQVRIGVRAVALNHLDLWVAAGLREVPIPSFPHVVGADAAGVVLETGSEVRHVAVGDRVVVNPGISCGHCDACRERREVFC